MLSAAIEGLVQNTSLLNDDIHKLVRATAVAAALQGYGNASWSFDQDIVTLDECQATMVPGTTVPLLDFTAVLVALGFKPEVQRHTPRRGVVLVYWNQPEASPAPTPVRTAGAGAIPLSPETAREAQMDAIPPGVISIFNNLIVENFSANTNSAKVLLEDFVGALRENLGNDFPSFYLDVENVYRAAGWLVEFDKPGYNESYNASFQLRKMNP